MTPPVANQDPATDPRRVALHTLVSYSISAQHDRAEADHLLTEHLAHLQRLHRNGEVLLAGPIASSDGRLDGGFALFRSPDPYAVQAFVDEDPAVGRLFTTTVRRWTPVVGQERLPSPGDPGRVAVEDTIHRLFVDGVSARDAEAYFDRTYHDDICIHEAPSLPYGGDYHGLEGVARHAIGFTRTWDRWQTGEQRQPGPRIIATDTEAIVLWTLRAQQARRSSRINLPDDQPLPLP